MYPHIRFAAFLVAKKKKLTIIRDVPIPEPREIAIVFPNITRSKKWFAYSGTTELKNNTENARIAYTIFGNKQTRVFSYLAVLRNLDPFAIFQKHFKMEVSPEAWELYKNVFFNVDGWDRMDLEVYKDSLPGVDRQIFDLCLSTSETEYILSELEIIIDGFEHIPFLHNMFMESYKKFMKEGRLDYGKFAVVLEKRISEVSQMTKRDVLKELNLELEGLQQTNLEDLEELEM